MLNRMLSIIYILMNKGTVTAGELAERFEVSMRTIYRDVETLSMAGIPVYAKKGKNGGISLTEQFVLDKMLVSRREQQEILAALASLRETGAQESGGVLEKLGEFFRAEPESWVAIDFSDWSGTRKELFEQIRQAVLGRHVIQFDYYGQYGNMSSRTAEPVQLLFKDYTWYLRAFCRVRQEMRLFKVVRMKRIRVLEETFVPGTRIKAFAQEYGRGPSENERLMEANMETCQITVQIHGKEAYRVYDRFEEEQISVLPDGNFEICMECSVVDDWIYGLILSFGPSARVVSPKEVQNEICRRISEMRDLYE
ncbi:MAG: YafY family transcriptional regulator [Lachnospiraceae bacterium]|nr:YafY family transcriptional regulator [Lachnospiraceae bacterium]